MNDIPTAASDIPSAASDIPSTAKDFQRWLIRRRAGMPPDLNAKAERAVSTLRSLEHPPAEESPTFMSESAKDLMDFAEAYGAWTATQKDKPGQNPG